METPTCTDDDGNTLTYSYDSGDDASRKFSVDSGSGEVTTTSTALDYDSSKKTYNLVILAVDTPTTGSAETATATIHVTVSILYITAKGPCKVETNPMLV